jgi:hypothetical protein
MRGATPCPRAMRERPREAARKVIEKRRHMIGVSGGG